VKVTTEAVMDPADLERVLAPRDGLVLEETDGTETFTQAEGPLGQYRRTVTTSPAPDGRQHVTQTVEFSLRLPYFSALFTFPLRWALGPLPPRSSQPWWAPPQRLDRRGAEVLATLCALGVLVGYVGSLLAITMTYAASEFGASRGVQGVALGVVRANVVLALGILILADRRGRRRLILACAAGAVALTALGAVAPSLIWLVASQILAVALTAALLVLVGVMAAEEMPPGSRAWALAVLTMTVGLGGGLATAALPLAGLGTRDWRLLYAGALVLAPLVVSIRRHLPESKRWLQPVEGQRSTAQHTRRLALLCAERAFSATRISVFSLFCGTIGGVGVLLGGRLADLRGRRLVAAVGAGGGIITTVAMFASRGWPLWAWGVADSILGYAVAPALGVYGPELFPTWQRSRSTGLVGLAYAAGGVVGLVAAGALSDHFGTFAPAFAVLAVGPAILVALIIWAYPETAQRTLEELNPE
jgi:MFS family permease